MLLHLETLLYLIPEWYPVAEQDVFPSVEILISLGVKHYQTDTGILNFFWQYSQPWLLLWTTETDRAENLLWCIQSYYRPQSRVDVVRTYL